MPYILRVRLSWNEVIIDGKVGTANRRRCDTDNSVSRILNGGIRNVLDPYVVFAGPVCRVRRANRSLPYICLLQNDQLLEMRRIAVFHSPQKRKGREGAAPNWRGTRQAQAAAASPFCASLKNRKGRFRRHQTKEKLSGLYRRKRVRLARVP
jgi:hypothetical protein